MRVIEATRKIGAKAEGHVPRRALRRVVTTMVLAGALLACGAPGPAGDSAQPTGETDAERVSGGQLTNLLAGADIRMVAPPSDGAGIWLFGCNGEWTEIGGQTGRIEGRYSVEGDRYCTEHSGIARQCNAVYRTRAGRFLIELDAEPGVPSPGSWFEATIAAGNSGCSP